MFKGNLKLSINESSLSFSLPVYNRILFFFIAVMLAVGVAYSDRNTGRLWIPLFLSAGAVLGGLYTEKWIFDKTAGTVSYFRGLAGVPFLNIKKEILFDEITAFQLSAIIRETGAWGNGRSYCKFAVELKTGESIEIDRGTGKHACSTIKTNAGYTALFCNKKLESY